MTKLSKGQRSRQRILAAALPVFAAGGCEGASLRRIAMAAQLSEPALYRHFTNKRQLYRQVLRGVAASLQQCLLRSLEGARRPADLVSVVDGLLLLMEQNLPLAALTQQLLAAGPDGATSELFQHWAGNCRKLGLADHPPGSHALRLLSVLSLCAANCLAREGLVAAWGEANYQRHIAPLQRQQMCLLLQQ